VIIVQDFVRTVPYHATCTILFPLFMIIFALGLSLVCGVGGPLAGIPVGHRLAVWPLNGGGIVDNGVLSSDKWAGG
jgi:hypothetical protein